MTHRILSSVGRGPTAAVLAALLVVAQASAQSPGTSPAPASPAPGVGIACPSPGPTDASPSAPVAVSPASSSAPPIAATPSPVSSPPSAASPSATGAAASPAASACPSPGADAVLLTIATTSALSLAFTESVLTAPAATLVTVEYLNDSPVPHNIAFHEGSDASAPLIAATPVETGPDNLQTVTFTTPAEPGSYYFLCDVHPTLMEGTLEVT